MLTCKLLWSCIPDASLDSYEARPSGERFAAFYDAMVARFRAHTSGMMGDHCVKCFLDLMVCSQVVPDHHLTRWPTSCPGYLAGLGKIFPTLPTERRLQALQFLHRELRVPEVGGARFRFPESCMQLCWDHRREAGSLEDSMA